MKPKILVIMSVFNGINYIKEQVDSILKQEDVNVNLFINFDKSNDGSFEYIKKIAHKDKRITLSEQNKYGSACQNFLNATKKVNVNEYDYISFSDQDDHWKPSKLKNAIRFLSDGYDGYSSNVTLWFYYKNKKKFINKSTKQTGYDHFFEAPGPTSSIVITKELFNKFQKFTILRYKYLKKLKNFFDILVYCFSIESNYKWYIDESSYILYRQHQRNELGYRYSFKSLKKRLHLILKFRWIVDLKIIWISVNTKNSKKLLLSFSNFQFFIRNIVFKFFLIRRSIIDKLLFFIILIYSFIFLRFSVEEKN